MISKIQLVDNFRSCLNLFILECAGDLTIIQLQSILRCYHYDMPNQPNIFVREFCGEPCLVFMDSGSYKHVLSPSDLQRMHPDLERFEESIEMEAGRLVMEVAIEKVQPRKRKRSESPFKPVKKRKVKRKKKPRKKRAKKPTRKPIPFQTSFIRPEQKTKLICIKIFRCNGYYIELDRDFKLTEQNITELTEHADTLRPTTFRENQTIDLQSIRSVCWKGNWQKQSPNELRISAGTGVGILERMN